MREKSGTAALRRPGKTGRLVAVFFTLALAAQLTSCGTTSGGGGPAPSAPPSESLEISSPPTKEPSGGSTSAPSRAAPESGCTATHPYRAETTTTIPAEVEYLDDIVACVSEDEASVSLTNNSDMVWAIFSTRQANVRSIARNPTVVEFHLLADKLYPYGFMAPKETISVDAGPESLDWFVHPELTAAWTTNAFLLKQIAKKGEAALQRALTGASKARQAVWACTKGVYDVGTAVPKLISSPEYDPAEQITTGLGIANAAGTCGTAWTAAEKEAGTAPRWTQVVDETHNALKPAGELAEKSSNLKNGVKAFLPLICKWLPRC
ncbi:hypothetical protein [Paenarthrobacter ureafaciens]|uniref:hypothetical protein n=1 Tax=Paenarthrobacter ureafaciens TaxID=37931 RepID=UPI00140AA23D|nr:hypothetical protein [Paenarthrobacter ureafaciens]MCX8453707.1 hypothetical protein [Paenarthrobacter ureafaciens]MCY0973366.1 hypothetical protein [Paenarthrobacter ureafaciens]